MKLLKNIIYYWKQICTIGLILISFSAIGFCLFKVTYALLNTTIEKDNGNISNWKPRSQSYPKDLKKNAHSMNSDFSIKLTEFLPIHEQASLKVGEKYYIIKDLNLGTAQTRCLYGVFQLDSKSVSHLNFHKIQIFQGKKLEYFASALSKSVHFSVLEQVQLPKNIMNCKNWVYIENSIGKINLEFVDVNRTSVMKYGVKKCKNLNLLNTVAVRSKSADLVYFQFDTVQNKLNMCANKIGNGIVEIMTLNSPDYQKFLLQIHK